MHRIVLFVALIVSFAAAACSDGNGDVAAGEAPEIAASPAATAAPTPEEPTEPPVDPAEVGANELGEVPVLMYHRILPDGGGEYDNTPEEFRAELQRLYDSGYRPITVRQLVERDIDLPAGTSPVVLTFDDGSTEQFAYNEDGEIAPDTAVGILLAFAEEHPDFTPVATMFVNAQPFAQADPSAMLTDLHERGFELGNHTANHANLSQQSAEGVQQELAAGARVVTEAVPGSEVTSLSLPFGVWSEPRELAYSGSHDGTDYEHSAIVLVGAGPSPSPWAAEFEGRAIPRIRSAAWDGGEPNYGSQFWLDWFDDNPQRRYVSDGDPETISFPEGTEGEVAPDVADRANPYLP